MNTLMKSINYESFFFRIKDIFSIIFCSKINLECNFVTKENIDDIINKIYTFSRKTGIMAESITIGQNILYQMIFDEIIIIIDENQRHHFQHFIDDISSKTPNPNMKKKIKLIKSHFIKF